jgi:putative ABC transport system permease protein
VDDEPLSADLRIAARRIGRARFVSLLRNRVIGQTLALAAAGVALGVLGSWALTRLLGTMLHDVKPTDPPVFAGTAVAVLLVTALAAYLPARWAARVDPVVVLRDL